LERAGVFNDVELKVSLGFLPSIFADFIRADRVVEYPDSVSVHFVGSDAFPSGYFIIDTHDAAVELEFPDPTGWTVVDATPADPPLGVIRIEFSIGTIDWSPFGLKAGSRIWIGSNKLKSKPIILIGYVILGC
jgi:hypothetical protein